ncbi:MAG: hypothetical protein PW792_01825 [Acidobacteriaceae bacterium]|nr:hypothetical protein [Acidobacteriaceae bacterium]
MNFWAIPLVAAMLVGGVSARGQRGRSHHAVTLTPGVCTTVSDGDVLTLDWNPQFEHSGAVTGIRRFELGFARPEDAEQVRRLGAPIELIAEPRAHGELPEQAGKEVESGENGSYHLHFHVALHGAAAGEYQLIAAKAYPIVPGEADAEKASQAYAMSHSPTALPFCLNVVDSEAGSGR